MSKVDRRRFRLHGRDTRQVIITEQVERLWGEPSARYLPERGARLLEEALEAAQAAGTPEDVALRLVRYVYSRQAGQLAQELGGVGVGVLALAHAAGLSADSCEVDGMLEVVAKCPSAVAAKMQSKRLAGIVCEPLENAGQMDALGQFVEEVVNLPERVEHPNCKCEAAPFTDYDIDERGHRIWGTER